MESLNNSNTHYGPLDLELVDVAIGTYFGIKPAELVAPEVDTNGASEVQVTFEE